MSLAQLAPALPPESVESAPSLPGPLSELFGILDGYTQRIPTLVDHLTRMDLPQAAFSALTDFDRRGYTRTTLHVGPNYEALLLCWLPDQHSAIHDHRGSHCAFRVLMGGATETIYSVDERGLAHAGEQNRYTTGFVASSCDLDVHRVSNLDGEDLVTLHIYSPPLGPMRTYQAV